VWSGDNLILACIDPESKYLGVGGRIILTWDLREIRCEVVNWIHLAQDRDRWRALVNTVMKLRVP
jgi:hypothetical protein